MSTGWQRIFRIMYSATGCGWRSCWTSSAWSGSAWWRSFPGERWSGWPLRRCWLPRPISTSWTRDSALPWDILPWNLWSGTPGLGWAKSSRSAYLFLSRERTTPQWAKSWEADWACRSAKGSWTPWEAPSQWTASRAEVPRSR